MKGIVLSINSGRMFAVSHFISVILLGGIAIFACQSSKNIAIQSKPIDFRNIDEAGNYNVTQRGISIIKNQEEWMELWQKYWNRFSGTGEKTPPPAVDFENRIVIVVHWGQGYSGCSNGVDVIQRIERIEDSVNVVIGELPDLGPCDMDVYPIQMVEIPTTDLPVRFSGATPGKDKF